MSCRPEGVMKRFHKGLIFKLGGVLLLLLFIKLMMIGVGIYSARHLKGDATAINYAGSERMRSYKLSFLINKWLHSEGEDKAALKDEIEMEIDRFEDILRYLREGDKGAGKNRYEEPGILKALMDLHPLLHRLLRLPGLYEPELKKQIEAVNIKWFTEVKPLLMYILNSPDPGTSQESFMAFNSSLPAFVDEVDYFVALLEHSSNRKVMVFTVMQYLFLFLTVVVTVVALYIIFLVTKKSVHSLMEGIRAMTAGDFSKRVNISSNDEMGELAEGFNFMAQKLEEFYGNLEMKVEEKTAALESRNRELSILYDMVASLNQSLPMEDILHVFLEKLQGHLGISGGAIRLCEDDGSLRLVACVGLNETFKLNMAFGDCLCGTLTRENLTDRWNMEVISEDVKMKECRECDYKGVVEIPLNYKGRFLGIINLFLEEPREFSPQEKRLIESLNNHLGAAIECCNLNVKTGRLAIMEERNMLASELHDSIAQSLAYLKIQGKLLEESLKSEDYKQAVEDLHRMRRGIEESNQNVRELLVHFRTKMEIDGLEATIRKYLARFRKETGIRTEFHAEEDIPVLSPDAEVHIFHIVQEALSNTRKYACATNVKVAIGGNGNFGVVIEDNGKGFDIEEVKNRRGSSHVGIDIMKERASRLGGSLFIDSKPGAGTRVILSLS